MVHIMAETRQQRIQQLKVTHKLLISRLLVHLVEHHHHADGVGEVVVWDYVVLQTYVGNQLLEVGRGQVG
jgi:hypothetical protein